MKKPPFSFTILLSFIQIYAQSYKGYINSNLSVWVDLQLSSSDSSITGTYFYEKIGEDIFLSGKINRDVYSLQEYSDGSMSGFFKLTRHGDTLRGTWNKPKGRKFLPVALYKVDPQQRIFAKVMNGKELYLKDGSTLAYQLESYSGEGFLDENDNPSINIPQLWVTYARHNILSTGFSWSSVGAYESHGVFNHTFNLITKQEIALWDEIAPDKMQAFNNYLCSKIQPILNDTRKEYPDSEWVPVIRSRNLESNEKESVNDLVTKFFTIKNARTDPPNTLITEGLNYCLDSSGIIYSIDGYFDFPHVIRAMDCIGEFTIPFIELKKYLKKESLFQSAAK